MEKGDQQIVKDKPEQRKNKDRSDQKEEKARPKRVYDSSDESVFHRRDKETVYKLKEKQRRDEMKELERRDRRDGRDRRDPRDYQDPRMHYDNYGMPMMPFGYAQPHPACPYHSHMASYPQMGGHHYNHGPAYRPGHHVRDYEDRSYDTDEETSSYYSESSVSSGSKSGQDSRDRIGKNLRRDVSSSSNEPQINPRTYDVKFPHQVGHHNFSSGAYNAPLYHQHQMSGHFAMPHSYGVSALHHPYIYPVPYPQAHHHYGNELEFNRDHRPPLHYPGHFFSPHHADIAVPDKYDYERRHKSSKTKSSKRKDRRRESDTIEEDKNKEDTGDKDQAVEDKQQADQKQAILDSVTESVEPIPEEPEEDEKKPEEDETKSGNQKKGKGKKNN